MKFTNSSFSTKKPASSNQHSLSTLIPHDDYSHPARTLKPKDQLPQLTSLGKLRLKKKIAGATDIMREEKELAGYLY